MAEDRVRPRRGSGLGPGAAPTAAQKWTYEMETEVLNETLPFLLAPTEQQLNGRKPPH